MPKKSKNLRQQKLIKGKKFVAKITGWKYIMIIALSCRHIRVSIIRLQDGRIIASESTEQFKTEKNEKKNYRNIESAKRVVNKILETTEKKILENTIVNTILTPNGTTIKRTIATLFQEKAQEIQ